MIEALLREGRAYHDSESERLAGELEAAAEGPIEARFWPQFLALANHTIGEHLGDWPRARALAERVLAGKTPGRDEASAWGKLATARFLAGDPTGAWVAETEYLRAAGEDIGGAVIDSRVTLATAMIGSKRVAEGAAVYEGVLGLALRRGATGADRGLAVASNNLATQLLEREERSQDEDALMQRAANSALDFWRKCGTWVNEERALYLLALVDNALGQPRQALDRIDAALALIAANGEEPVDVAFLHLARANACAKLGDRDGRRRDLADAEALAATWADPGLEAWFADERKKIHRL